MKIIDFLNKHNIEWQPININSKKEPVDTNGVIPRTNDVRMKIDLSSRRNFLDTAYIVIHTDNIQQVDIDDPNFVYDANNEHIKTCPYFLSIKKKLPHYFVKMSSSKTHTPIIGGDLLTGQWGYCPRNAIVENHENKMHSFKLSDFTQDQNKEKKEKIQHKITGYIDQLKMNPENDNYSNWSILVNALYNMGISNNFTESESKMFATIFSKDSPKYNDNAKKIIQDLNGHMKVNEDYVKKIIKNFIFKEQKIEFDDSNFEDEPIINKEPKDLGLKSYYECKIDFEKNHFKHIGSGNICRINGRKLESFSRSKCVDMYEHLKYSVLVEKELVSKGFINAWLKDHKMRIYKDIGFYPYGAKCPINTFNAFLGFDVEDIKASNMKINEMECDPKFMVIINHLKMLFETNYYYFIWLLHDLFKNPGIRNNIATFLTSVCGTGKTIIVDLLFRNIMGTDYVFVTTKPKEIFGDFNASVHNKIIVCADELKENDMILYREEMSGLISGNKCPINKKGIDISEETNYVHAFLFTNEGILNTKKGERRYFANLCSAKAKNEEYFIELAGIFNDTKYQRMFYDFIIDDSQKKPDNKEWIKDSPISAFSEDMKLISIPIEEIFIKQFMDNKYSTYKKLKDREEDKVSEDVLNKSINFQMTPSELHNEFKFFMAPSKCSLNPQKLSIKLKDVKIKGFSKITNSSNNSYFVFDILDYISPFIILSENNIIAER